MNDNGGAYGIETSGANGSTITHLYINGGWIKQKTNGIVLDGVYTGQLTNTVLEGCTVYGIKVEAVAAFVFQTGEISGSGSGEAIYFNPSVSLNNTLLAPSTIRDTIDFTNYKPSVFDMNQMIQRGSTSQSLNNQYYSITKTSFIYDNVFSIAVRGETAQPERTIVQYGQTSGLMFDTENEISFKKAGVITAKIDTNTHFVPGVDAVSNLGGVSKRWATVYAATGTINTSDGNEKQQIRHLSDVEKAVGIKCKSLMRAFKFNEAVANKESSARIHFGVIAQDIQAAFESEGLNAEDYGVFCSDKLEDGSVRLGVRYDELFAFILGAM